MSLNINGLGRMLMLVGLIGTGMIPLLDAMPSQDSGSEDLLTLFNDMWHWKTQENPEFATQVGLNDNTAGRLDSFTSLRFQQRTTYSKELLERCNQISPEDLTKDDMISLSTFKHILENYIKNSPLIRFFHPITVLEGPQLQLQHLVSNFMILESYNDFQKLLSRYGEFPRQADEILEILEQNMQNGIMPHRLSMEGVLQQLDSLDVPVIDSPFFKPFLKIPLSFPPEQRRTLRQQAQERISQDLLPSFTKIRQLLNDVYLAMSRPSPGISSVVNGTQFYMASLEFFTSTKLRPSEVHSIGLSEVKRIEELILPLATDCEYAESSTAAEVLTAMRQQHESSFQSLESIVESLRVNVFDRIKPLIPSLFDSLPADNLTIDQVSVEIPLHTYPIWYEAPSLDGNRPGFLHVDQNHLEFVSKYDLVPLALNLCYPGKHFQSVLLQVSPKVPSFRKVVQGSRWSFGPVQLVQSPAFVEGWAAYSEFLGDELNLYPDSCSRLSQTTRELAAAVRLVVDTGVHALEWSLESAAEYFRKHTTLHDRTIQIELTHIVAFPGKACSAKIGEIKLHELRQRARNALGSMFSSKEFHKVLLQCTSPLHVAQQCIANYIRDNIHIPDSDDHEHSERDVQEETGPTGSELLVGHGATESSASIPVITSLCLVVFCIVISRTAGSS